MKRMLLIFAVGVFITIFLSVVVSGIGSKVTKDKKNSDEIAKYNINSKDISLNNQNGSISKIKIYITKEKKIVELPLEEYVLGVVAGEMPAEFNIEALKAQAVAVRTYAISHAGNFGLPKCNEAHGADLCDTVHCQVYMSKNERLKFWSKNKSTEYWNKITEAVSKTEGQVLTYNGQLVLHPYYFSTSSGKTENSKDIFDIDEPYLKSVESFGEEKSPKYKSKIKISYKMLAAKINSNYSKAGIKAASLKNQIKILSNTDGGSVKDIKMGNITVAGTDFRSILGLNSANFSIKYCAQNIEITSKGYGHDVGMSQWGADSMAEKGGKYIDILKHYYQGVDIEKIKD